MNKYDDDDLVNSLIKDAEDADGYEWEAQVAQESHMFLNNVFVPRNELDSKIYNIIKTLSLHTIECFNEDNGENVEKQKVAVDIDKQIDDFLTDNSIPLDKTTESDYGFCRDWYYERFYARNFNAIYELSDDIGKRKKAH